MATKRPKKKSKSDPALALLDWVRSIEGGSVGQVEVRSDPSLGRGLWATADMAAGDCLFEVPSACVLTTDVALRSPIGRQLAAACRIVRATSDSSAVRVIAEGGGEGEGAAGAGAAGAVSGCDDDDGKPELTERSVLYAYLLATKHCAGRAAGGAHAPYVRCLPRLFSTPFSWRDELALLPDPMSGPEHDDHEGVDLVSELGAIGRHLQAQYQTARAALAAAAAAAAAGGTESGDGLALLRSGKLSAREWLWAHQAYSSRCFPRACLAHGSSDGSGGGGGEDEEGEDGILVPLLDICNSVEEGNHISWQWEQPEEQRPGRGRGRATLGCAVRAGEQLFLRYGRVGNSALLACYGYCRWDNPSEKVALWLSALRRLSRNEACAESNARTLRAFQDFARGGGGEEVCGLKFELTLADPLPTRLLDAARICCGGPAAAGGSGSDGGSGSEAVDDAAACGYVRELLREARAQVLGAGENAEEELAAAVVEWRARDDGSTVRLAGGGGAVTSYACSAEACALAFRHSQLVVLSAAQEALAAKDDERGKITRASS